MKANRTLQRSRFQRRHISLLLAALLLAPAAVATAVRDSGSYEALTGHVTRADMRAVPRPGDRCEVVLSPEARMLHECRLQVVCEGAPVWGGALGGGDARCLAEDGRFTQARKQQFGLVWLRLNRTAGRLQVRDARGYPIEIRF